MRFPSKRSVLRAYEQKRAPVRNQDDSNNRILTHDGHISPTLILIGHVGNESSESSLHKVFVSCDLNRRRDSGELPALFRDSLNDIYEDLILNNDGKHHPSGDIIDSLVTSILAADIISKTNITLNPTYLLYLFEFSRIYKAGGIASPYATIEWQGVQTPQALTAIL